MMSDSKLPWDQVSSEWIAFIRGPDPVGARQHILLPAVRELCGAISGRRILDIGCGEGQLCRLLRDLGAEVTGIDAAPSMIEAARAEEEHRRRTIVYEVRDASGPHSGGPFDIITAVLLLHMLEDPGAVVKAAARALRRRGHFVAAILHPAFDGVGEGWVLDQDGDVQWSVDRYVEEIRGVSPLGVSSFHRPLSYYFGLGFEAGLQVDGFLEPIAPAWISKQLRPEARARVPALAVIRFRKG
jgi:SAM-dependent methyltransferase